MKKLFSCVCLFMLVSALGWAQVAQSNQVSPRIPALPLNISDEEFQPLYQYHESDLVSALNAEIQKQKKWQQLVASKRLSLGVVDLRDPNNPRFAGINENEMMYAASLPKIAILLAALDAIESGTIPNNAEIQRDLRLMISKSNNQASTRLIDLLGYDQIESVLIDPRYNLYDEDHGGGLWVGKRYAQGGQTNREPLKNLSHAATAFQVCRFYYMLAYGRLVTKEKSSQMLGYLESPELHHKFVNTLDRIAPVARLFRKSGTWKSFHSDSVLVWGQNRRYILVALVNDVEGEQIIRNLVVPVERAMDARY